MPDGLVPHIFLAILVHGQMHCTERPASYLLLYKILVDAVLCGAVIFAVAVLGPRIERLLPNIVRSELSTASVY